MVNRIKTAIEFLKDGEPFTVEDLRLDIEENNMLSVTGWSEYRNFENLNKNNSIKELELIKELFKIMCDTSIELRSFIIGKEIIYRLYFDDYGKASISICLERNGIVKWEADIKE